MSLSSTVESNEQNSVHRLEASNNDHVVGMPVSSELNDTGTTTNVIPSCNPAQNHLNLTPKNGVYKRQESFKRLKWLEYMTKKGELVNSRFLIQPRCAGRVKHKCLNNVSISRKTCYCATNFKKGNKCS